VSNALQFDAAYFLLEFSPTKATVEGVDRPLLKDVLSGILQDGPSLDIRV
jgi:hypothetical protein